MKELEQAITTIIRVVQEEAFGEVLKSKHYVQISAEESHRDRVKEKKRKMKKSSLFRLDPFISWRGWLIARRRASATRKAGIRRETPCAIT